MCAVPLHSSEWEGVVTRVPCSIGEKHTMLRLYLGIPGNQQNARLHARLRKERTKDPIDFAYRSKDLGSYAYPPYNPSRSQSEEGFQKPVSRNPEDGKATATTTATGIGTGTGDAQRN